jgi:hypothetical protein
MTLIRFGQPRLTAVFPHNGNAKFIITPLKGVPAPAAKTKAGGKK